MILSSEGIKMAARADASDNPVPTSSASNNGVQQQHNSDRTVLIGVAGGTASGKSSVCRKIIEHLGEPNQERQRQQVVVISQESFYRNLDPGEQKLAVEGKFNFDHPDAFDEDLMVETFRLIKEGKVVKVPTYDFVHAQRSGEANWKIIYPANVVLFEGILVFYFKEMRDLFNLKLFVDTDADTRLSRRVKRDMAMGRELNTVLNQYTTFVKPAFEDFCLPTKKHADMIIPRGADNKVAISLIVQHIRDLLKPNGQPAAPVVHRRTRQNSDSTVSRPH